jgi:DNA-binding NarL/FixJ family response regulator
MSTVVDRVQAPPAQGLMALEELAERQHEWRMLGYERDQAVIEAVLQGATWLQVARALGKPRQNVERQYREVYQRARLNAPLDPR